MITYHQFVVFWRKHVARKWWFGLTMLLFTLLNAINCWIFMFRHSYSAAICAGMGALFGAFSYFVYIVCRHDE